LETTHKGYQTKPVVIYELLDMNLEIIESPRTSGDRSGEAYRKTEEP